MTDPIRQRWQAAGAGWRRRADGIRAMGMPVSAAMIDQLDLQAGYEVLELAAGPGDTGFMAAELVRPSGRLICSDAVEEMLDIARERASEQQVHNVEFKLLELEWVDLETASVDAVLCRWGLMFVTDTVTALKEMRRVLRPGGRLALATWAAPERNPWATIPTQALVELGHAEPPDRRMPGMFALDDPGRLREQLEEAGFTEVEVAPVPLGRERPDVEEYLAETIDLSRPFAEVRERLSEPEWQGVQARVRELAAPFTTEDRRLALPGEALVSSATG